MWRTEPGSDSAMSRREARGRRTGPRRGQGQNFAATVRRSARGEPGVMLESLLAEAQ
jgi:hypothetical protein